MDDQLIKINKLLHYSLNADASCVSIGTRSGLFVYNLDPVVKRLKDCVGEGFRIVELLYCTSLLVMVASGENPGSSPRKLKLWNSQNKDTIAEIPFDSTIVNCKLNKSRLVVYIDTQQIHIFELATMKCIQILSTNSSSGMLALSSEPKSCLAFPGYPGRVVLYDATNCRLLTQITAHKSNVTQLQFDRQSSKLATASETGTVIRVFSVPNGDLLFSFRRGIHHCTINSISFCPNSKFLSVGASSGTIHVFLLEQRNIYDSIAAKFADMSSQLEGANGAKGSGSDGRSQGSSSNSLTSTEGWAEAYNSIKTTAVFGFMNAVKYVGSLNVLPPVAQEFVDSYRAVCICRLPGGESEFKAALTLVTTSLPSHPSATGTASNKPANAVDSSTNQMKVVVVTPNGCVYRFLVPTLDDLIATYEASAADQNLEFFECPLEEEAFLLEDEDD